jgi:hypothetical protein
MSVSFADPNAQWNCTCAYHTWNTEQLLDERRLSHTGIPTDEDTNSFHVRILFTQMVFPKDDTLVWYSLRPNTAEGLLECPTCRVGANVQVNIIDEVCRRMQEDPNGC